MALNSPRMRRVLNLGPLRGRIQIRSYGKGGPAMCFEDFIAGWHATRYRKQATTISTYGASTKLTPMFHEMWLRSY
jgi:hypothetical protein